MTTISFYPKFTDLSVDERDTLVASFRKWLDQHGDYGRLYMMDIDKAPGEKHQSSIIGVRIFDEQIATLFKLMHEI